MPDFGRWTANGGDPSLNEINRTDRFLDALASQQPVYSTDPGEAELAQLLAGWRDEVRTPPLMAPVTPRDAVVALTRAVESRKRTRTSMAVVGSVAAAVLCLGGFGAVVAGAGPGDPLYGLRTMLFGEQQQTRDDQVMLASQQLAEVQQLIDEGQWDAAQDKLQTLTTTVATVNDVEQKQELVTQWQELTVKVDAKDAAATLPPGAPPPPMPDAGRRRAWIGHRDNEHVVGDKHAPPRPSETTTSSSETSTSTSSATTSSPTSSSPVPEPPPPSGTPTTTTPPTSPTDDTTTTTTTTHAVTTTTTTPPRAGGCPRSCRRRRPHRRAWPQPARRCGCAAECGRAGSGRRRRRRQLSPPPAVASEAPPQRAPESQAPESQATETNPGHDHADYATAQEARRRRIEGFSPQRYPSDSDVASLSDASA